ncbi:protein FAR-RED ELONGATED HYPOCOTYL 3-like [Humulus lupulus]|uniref:protein FAR-RED ELONGATED HYPOCOTYL 3-like n=1 Tax=Humulus lupulus TaxID=3486 RepID=UPI002B412FF6|nr:protein FAR-RED ELONGATED HYPOCOTYL 3-like [Humulus lupulus]
MWAESFLHGQFVTGMRTTQQCESMKFFLKRFLIKRYSLREFVTAIDIGVTNLRRTENENDYLSKHTIPQIPPRSEALRTYYEQCAKFYTRAMYDKVVKQIKKENGYFISSHEGHLNCTIFGVGNFRDGQKRYRVTHTLGMDHFTCSCLFYETNGYPCRHIWAVMKSCCVRIIPNSLLLKQWSIHAKSEDENTEETQATDEHTVQCEMSRFGVLNLDATMMNFYASKSPIYFKTTKNEISRLTIIFKEGFEIHRDANNTHRTCTYRDNPNIIQDPIRVRTKGQGNTGPRRDARPTIPSDGIGYRQRACGKCGELGHNSRTCPNRGARLGRGRVENTSRQGVVRYIEPRDEFMELDTNVHYSTQESFGNDYNYHM